MQHLRDRLKTTTDKMLELETAALRREAPLKPKVRHALRTVSAASLATLAAIL
jgi:hypothetical protein